MMNSGASSPFIVDAQIRPQSCFCHLRNGVIFSALHPPPERGGLGPVHRGWWPHRKSSPVTVSSMVSMGRVHSHADLVR